MCRYQVRCPTVPVHVDTQTSPPDQPHTLFLSPRRAVAAFDFTFVVAGPNNNSGSFRIVTGGTGCDDYTTDLSGLVYAPSNGGNSYRKVKT